MMKTRATDKKTTNENELLFSDNIPTIDRIHNVRMVNEITKTKIMSGEYKLSGRLGTSKIWLIFARILDANGKEKEGIVVCKKCYNIYKFESCTSNLRKHICYRIENFIGIKKKPRKIDIVAEKEKDYCPEKKNEVPQIKINRSLNMSMEVDVETKRDKRPNKSMDVDMESKRDKCPQKSMEVDMETKIYKLPKKSMDVDMETKIYKLPKKSMDVDMESKIYKLPKKSMQVDMETKIYKRPKKSKEVDVETKINNSTGDEIDAKTIKKGIHILTNWTIKNGRPFSIIDDSGLKNFAEFFIAVGAKYGQRVNMEKLLPDPSTISQNLLKLYEIHFEELRNDILMFNNCGYSITSDIWIDKNSETSYLYLMIHYIKEGSMVNRLLAVKSIKEVNCDDEKIKEIINKVLHEFCCDLEKDNPTIVSARRSNKIAAFRDLNNIQCVNHLLHKVIERTINEVPELMNMVIRCNKIVEYFLESGMNSNLEYPLKSYCPNRWNTMFYLFKSIETNWNDISNILIDNDEIYLMEEIDLSHLRSIINLLVRFESYSKKLEDNSNPTLHLAIPYINHLKKTCKEDPNDADIVKHCKDVLLELLQSKVLKKFSKFHNIALFLFPPTNKLSQFTETEKEDTIDDCSEIMKVFIDESATTDNHDLLSPPTAEENDIFADFCQTCESNNINDRINNEIQRYQVVKIGFSEDFNVLHWWNNNKEEFPYLYKTSCKVLATPASSGASEMVFSTIKKFIADKRYKIDANEDVINQLMFLHTNIESLNESVLDE